MHIWIKPTFPQSNINIIEKAWPVQAQNTSPLNINCWVHTTTCKAISTGEFYKVVIASYDSSTSYSPNNTATHGFWYDFLEIKLESYMRLNLLTGKH